MKGPKYTGNPLGCRRCPMHIPFFIVWVQERPRKDWEKHHREVRDKGDTGREKRKGRDQQRKNKIECDYSWRAATI